jgi:hypothetical protein
VASAGSGCQAADVPLEETNVGANHCPGLVHSKPVAEFLNDVSDSAPFASADNSIAEPRFAICAEFGLSLTPSRRQLASMTAVIPN